MKEINYKEKVFNMSWIESIGCLKTLTKIMMNTPTPMMVDLEKDLMLKPLMLKDTNQHQRKSAFL